MKILPLGIFAILSSLVFTARLDAAPSPSPTPTQLAPPIPPEMTGLHNKLVATLSPVARAWTTEEAGKAATNTKVTEGTIRADIQTRFTGQSLEEKDKAVLLFVILHEAVQNMDNDLNTMVGDIQKKAQKQNPPAPGPGGTTTITLSATDSMDIEAVAERRAQFMAAMATVKKKISDAQSTAVGFLK